MRSSAGTARRWLALGMALAFMLLVSAAFLPGPWHHGENTPDCPVCHIGHQPGLVASVTAQLVLLAPVVRLVAAKKESADRDLFFSQRSPRGPPA